MTVGRPPAWPRDADGSQPSNGVDVHVVIRLQSHAGAGVERSIDVDGIVRRDQDYAPHGELATIVEVPVLLIVRLPTVSLTPVIVNVGAVVEREVPAGRVVGGEAAHRVIGVGQRRPTHRTRPSETPLIVPLVVSAIVPLAVRLTAPPLAFTIPDTLMRRCCSH